MKLFRIANPLSARFGDEFFRALPDAPGVYRFLDDGGELLYIGQSSDLRARVGSYRHVTPETNSRRTLRLVARVAHIEWTTCASPADAIDLERDLLLEHRPRFNRAGVWQGDPWWLTAKATPAGVDADLTREPGAHGPLKPSFRYLFGSLVRGVYRTAFPHWRLSDFPHGTVRSRIPTEITLTLPDPAAGQAFIEEAAAGETSRLVEALAAIPARTTTECEFWEDEIDRLARHGGIKHSHRIDTASESR